MVCSVKYFTFSVFCYLDLISGQNWRERRPIVRISQGILEGTRIYTESGRSVNSFLGVPYAAPPLDNLRFAPPRKHHGWNGTLQASIYPSQCPQLPFKPGVTDNEDCLYLNIWTPENADVAAPLPVVIFFEGKDFYQSSSFPISGQDLAAEGLVMVTINYRLNVFGFFCLGNSQARGNLGMLDQYFGLRWIKENIRRFGGDPEKITLYGHGSGAVSVTFHMVSPRTAGAGHFPIFFHFPGLFQRVILSSGSAVTPWQLYNDPVTASKQIIRMLGCQDPYTTNPVACLRSKKVEHILQALNEYSESLKWNDKFLPVIDTFLSESNRYFPLDPAKALKEGTYMQVPILTGISRSVASEQYAQWLELASQGYTQLQQYIEKAKILEIIRMYRFSSPSKDQVAELIKWRYFSSNEGDVRALFDQLKRLEFDAKIEAPHYLQLSYLVSSYVQPIYVYFMDEIGLTTNTTDSTLTTDLLLLFGPHLLRQVGRRRFNNEEMNLSRTLKQLWTNFINFGNPTPNNQITEWRKYTTEDYYIKHLEDIKGHSHRLDKTRTESVMFWNQLLPKISNFRNSATNSIPKELQNSPDPAAGFRHAMYTLVALVIALLALLLICIVLLKRRSKERESHLHMGY